MRRLALLILTIAIAGCIGDPNVPPDDPQERTLAEVLDDLLATQGRPSQAALIDEALARAEAGRADPAACARVAGVATVASRLDEVLARRVVRLFRYMQCPQQSAPYEAVVRGRWLARSGVIRSSAMDALAEGARLQLWAEGQVDAIAMEATAERTDLLRASAYAWLLRDIARPEWAEWQNDAANDESEWVRAVATSAELGAPQ